jgi:hypothetical protein
MNAYEGRSVATFILKPQLYNEYTVRLQAPAAIPPGQNCCNHSKESSVGPRTDFDDLEKEKSLVLTGI